MRLCEARRLQLTGCAYFMAAAYHESLPLKGGVGGTRPTYTEPRRASKAPRDPPESICGPAPSTTQLLLNHITKWKKTASSRHKSSDISESARQVQNHFEDIKKTKKNFNGVNQTCGADL